jgi:hypothetical protein
MTEEHTKQLISIVGDLLKTLLGAAIAWGTSRLGRRNERKAKLKAIKNEIRFTKVAHRLDTDPASNFRNEFRLAGLPLSDFSSAVRAPVNLYSAGWKMLAFVWPGWPGRAAPTAAGNLTLSLQHPGTFPMPPTRSRWIALR